MSWRRAIRLGLPLLLLAALGRPAAAAPCAIGVPGCCATDPDCDDADVCTGTETCETATGTCQAGTAAADGTACTDGDACTRTDRCQSGACVGTDPIVCDDLDPCTLDACDPGTGVCETTPAPDGTPCNDLNACTRTDRCAGGACVGIDPLPCDDGNPCTTDACVPALGACAFVPDEDGLPCDDANACTQTDTCQAGTCMGTDPIACDDGNPCTADACDPATGACVATALPDATACDDGDGCTTDDACAGGVCVPGPPRACDDGVSCTIDACADGLCVAIPDDARCSADACAVAACAPGDPAADAAGCVRSAVLPDGAMCTEDLDPCTYDRCAGATCVHEEVGDLAACDPVRDPFRQALVLAAFATAVADEIAVIPKLDPERRTALLAQVGRLVQGLEDAAAALGGAGAVAESAKARATAALVPLRRLPREARRLARLLVQAGTRDPLLPADITRLVRTADDLRAGVRALKRDVRRLRRALRRFVR